MDAKVAIGGKDSSKSCDYCSDISSKNMFINNNYWKSATMSDLLVG